MHRHWFALYTYPRHEKTVHEYLKQSAVEAFLPLYTAVHRWRNGVKASVQLPLFPGYVFVKTEPQDCGRLVRVPSVASVLSSRGIPLAVPAREIEVLTKTISALSFEPHPFIRVGAEVRVKNGPLAGLEGIVIQKKSGCRFLLRMSLLMQAAAVDIDACDVEAIGPSSKSSGFGTCIEDPKAHRPSV
jgi:transcription antitermination factor NusG